MSSTLDSKYYRKVLKKDHEKVEYTGYIPVNNPVVLVSMIDGTFIAGLDILTNDSSGSVQSLFTKRPNGINDDCHFQGLISDNDQEFSFVVTNFMEKDHINFNILKKDENNNFMPKRLNDVNIVEPMKSLKIDYDCETNCALVLSSINIPATDPEDIKKNIKTKSLTVEEEEKNGKNNKNDKKGTYYYIVLSPQMTHIDNHGKNIFERTKWMCVDAIVLKRPKQIELKKEAI